MENTKKTKKKVRTKGQKIRSIIMMALLCIAMMSGATYAWFTLSNTARVTNMQLTVGEASGLMIAPEVIDGNVSKPGAFGTKIELSKIEDKLMPATSGDGISFYSPVYDNDGNVSGNTVTIDSIPNDSKRGYYYSMNFYLKAEGQPLTVRLKEGSRLADDFTRGTSPSGTYLALVDGGTKKQAVSAMRLSLVQEVDNNNKAVIVYEPNIDVTDTSGSKAEDNRTTGKIVCITSTDTQKTNGKFTKNEGKIELKAGIATKITMNVWIEGSDAQCVNEISAADLIGQLQFTTDNNTIESQ